MELTSKQRALSRRMCKHLRSNLSDRQGKLDTGDYPGAG